MRVGVAELRVRGELATRISSTDFWPFLAPYNQGDTPEASDKGYSIKVRNIWPITEKSDSINVTTRFLDCPQTDVHDDLVPKRDLRKDNDGWLELKITNPSLNCRVQAFLVKDEGVEVLPAVIIKN